MTLPVYYTRRLEDVSDKAEGRQLTGIYCVLCSSWGCDSEPHRWAKRAIYIRSPVPGANGESPSHPNPHHEGVARYHLTAKGEAAVSDLRFSEGRE